MQIGILVYPNDRLGIITIVSLFLNVELICPVEIRIIPPQSS